MHRILIPKTIKEDSIKRKREREVRVSSIKKFNSGLYVYQRKERKNGVPSNLRRISRIVI
jgi:hypothetical protein